MAPRVLITGISGFVGRHLARHLLGQGHQVHGLDRLDAPEDLRPNASICDLLDRDDLQKILESFRPEMICHLAAETDLHTAADRQIEVNCRGTENLLDSIERVGSVRRVIFTSTQLVMPLGAAPTSAAEPEPDTAYGRSKWLMEQLVSSRNGGGTEWCIVRPTTVWGPEMSEHYLAVFRRVRSGLYFHIGRESPLRSLSYIGNLVHQYERLLTAPANRIQGLTFFAADYEPVSIRQWTESVARETGSTPIRSIPRPIASAAAAVGDALGKLRVRFPLTSFRLRNLTTEAIVDTRPLQEITGPLPYTFDRATREFAAWLNARRSPAAPVPQHE